MLRAGNRWVSTARGFVRARLSPLTAPVGGDPRHPPGILSSRAAARTDASSRKVEPKLEPRPMRPHLRSLLGIVRRNLILDTIDQGINLSFIVDGWAERASLQEIDRPSIIHIKTRI